MKRSLSYLTVLFLAAPVCFGQERQFCTVPADCVPDTEAIRFGAPGDRNSSITAKANDEITALVTFDVTSVKVQGWSMGVKHDATKLQLLEVTHKAPELPLTDAELFFPVSSNAQGDPAPGFITAVVLSIFPPPGKVLPVGQNFPVAKARYKVLTDLAAPTKLEFVDTLNPPNSPPTKVNLTVDGKTRRPDKVTDAEVKGEVVGCTKNTCPGANVTPALTCGATITFATVTAEGDTTCAAQANNPQADAGKEFAGQFFDIASTAVFTGNATVTLSYLDNQVPAGSTEADLVLYHLVGGVWQPATNIVRDGAGNKVSGVVTSLSFFALAVVKGVPTCDDYAIYFGTDPAAANLAIPAAATSFTMSMRNQANALAFSLGVKVTGTNYALVDELVGTGAPNPNVDLVITDNTGTDRTPKINTASGGPATGIGTIARGAAIAGFGPDKDFFVFDTNPGVGGPGFFVAYVSDKTAAQTQEIPATASVNPCPVNEILIVSYGTPPSKFSRGDCNGDGRLNITDAVIDARNIFTNSLVKFDCKDMLDANNDGTLDASDPISILNWLFLKGPALPDPFKACGADTGAADQLDCKAPNCQ